ncbi:rhodanese-related sulfurtransferase [Parvularcula sp. ZS-1/3]|uniref:tRNA uridine(34) hydroxylase n=1 Tax=Parvularcula mediterranea TaxID=2732508 RepID=A0A7Y3RMJ5_9PROT|nr:rhodanese-related sulfurtransferase [Parvularcula mediterranea]NNU16365.1 rhodanese-related sulfurtransferase [Parvularcula mediterranea]
MSQTHVAALYHFAPLDELERRREELFSRLGQLGIRGTLLIAPEGINGTIAGLRDGLDQVVAQIRSFPGFEDLEVKWSTADEQPFLRTKVRIKKEIVTMGVPGIDPTLKVGRYVEARDWNKVLQDPDTIVVDTRNDYEVEIGTFTGAINPDIESFREFPAWFDALKAENPDKRIAMFCTGGIRCEKSTSYAIQQGAEDVVHLKGGILKYLEHVDQADSQWEGECFVFDGRVAVRHGLEEGTYDLCHACRRPIDEEMKADARYVPGVSCPHCVDAVTDEKRERFAERQKQMELAKARGTQHLGVKQDG